MGQNDFGNICFNISHKLVQWRKVRCWTCLSSVRLQGADLDLQYSNCLTAGWYQQWSVVDELNPSGHRWTERWILHAVTSNVTETQHLHAVMVWVELPAACLSFPHWGFTLRVTGSERGCHLKPTPTHSTHRTSVQQVVFSGPIDKLKRSYFSPVLDLVVS